MTQSRNMIKPVATHMAHDKNVKDHCRVAYSSFCGNICTILVLYLDHSHAETLLASSTQASEIISRNCIHYTKKLNLSI